MNRNNFVSLTIVYILGVFVGGFIGLFIYVYVKSNKMLHLLLTMMVYSPLFFLCVHIAFVKLCVRYPCDPFLTIDTDSDSDTDTDTDTDANTDNFGAENIV